MKVVVFGATGATGAEIVKSCTEKGFGVVAAARRVDAIKAPAGVSKVKMDFGDEASLRAAMAGCDVVVSAIGTGGLKASSQGTDLYSVATRALRAAMRKEGVCRIIVLSSGGTVSDGNAPWFYNNVIRPYVMNTYIDMARMEAILEESAAEIEFTAVRLTFLGKWKSAKVIVGDGTLEKAAFKISYADAGKWVADEIEERKWINKFPVPSYP